MTTGSQIVTEARSWLDTPFAHQAILKGVGCDCRGLLMGVALALGIDGAEAANADPACHQYARQPHADALCKACERYLDPIPLSAIEPGDVLMMTYRSTEPRHFGIVTCVDPLTMIHAFAAVAQKVTEHRLDDRWRARIVGAYRFRGLQFNGGI